MTDLDQLTPRERQVYEFLRREIGKRRRTPTFREIVVHCGFKSQASVSHYLDTLQQKGLIRRERRKRRAISLVRRSVSVLPLYGRIGAGSLNEAIESQESLDVGQIIGKEGRAVLRVDDDSLVGLAIPAGSYLVIDPTCGWRKVVAMIRPVN